MEKQAINSLLATLSPQDLKEVKARVLALLPADAIDAEVIDPIVYAQLVSVLADHGVRSVPPMHVILKFKWAKTYRDGSETLTAYIDEYLLPKNRAQRVAAVRILISTIANWMVMCGLPVTPRTLSQQMKNVDRIIEDEFPGYREAGLLAAILLPKEIKKLVAV